MQPAATTRRSEETVRVPVPASRRWPWAAVTVAAVAAVVVPIPTGAALLAGMVFGVLGLNPAPKTLKYWQTRVLGVSVALMGVGLDVHAVVAVGTHGVLLTAGLLVAVFGLGHFLARALGLDRDESLLVSAGTAICGASAIASLTAALKPKESAAAYALTVVFVLNAVALVALPPVGKVLGLTDSQFAWWAGLAIHDTSSVVGAALAFGGAAPALATTVKLSRALWIVPMTAVVSARRNGRRKVRWSIPWFLPAFLVLSAIFTVSAVLEPVQLPLVTTAKRGFVLGLFLVGFSLDRETVRRFPPRLALYGLALWLWSLAASLAPAWILGAR